MAVTFLSVLVIAGLVLLLIGGIGVLTLIKLGVIAKYAVEDEPQDHGVYGLDQSRSMDDE